MLQLRPKDERGFVDHGWLKATHTFSFGNYYDPNHMGFRDLRVMNEDRIDAGAGFPMLGHKDMEIITYVISGQLAHKDSLGNMAVIEPGVIQRMSAGSGIRHSEFNPSDDAPIHLYQIWLMPNENGIAPSYEERPIPVRDKKGAWCLVASPDAREDSLKIHQDVFLYAALLGKKDTLTYDNQQGRHAWVQVVKGTLRVNDLTLVAGDGLAISGDEKLTFGTSGEAEILLFDLC